MKIEEWVVQTTGTIEGLMLICAFIAASSPEARNALAHLQHAIDEAKKPENAKPSQQLYIEGMNTAAQALARAMAAISAATAQPTGPAH